MSTRTRKANTKIDRRQAISLLYPIAAFFSSGGMSREQSLAALSAAIDNVRRSEGGRELEHIGVPTSYADVIATWTRERKFLDSHGRPRALSVSGANGFAALVKSACPGQDPKKLLSVLVRYKNVRRLSNGKVQLVSPLFRTSAGSRMAFEPITYFLTDAASALTHTLKNANASAKPDLFWRTVDSVKVSQNNANRFVEFAKERSLLFLEEMEDWLQAHTRATSRPKQAPLRIGLGLFSIYSRDVLRPARQ